MRNQSLLITACAVSLLLLMLMPMASAAELIVIASYDGSVGNTLDASWVTMRNAPGNDVFVLRNNTFSGQTYTNASNSIDIYDKHYRGLVTWNTGAVIPVGATITSAVVSVYGHDSNNTLGIVNFSIIDANPDNKLAYVGGDYSKTTFTRFAPDIPFNSFVNGDWNNFTLNALGRTNINKTGLTTFMFTHSADVDNSPLTWKNDALSAFEIKGINDTEVARKPFITIVYTPALPVLTVSASPETVTVGTPTNVNFTVKNQSSGLVVSGATVGLTGLVTDSGTTDVNGNATFSVTAGSVGIITATASMSGYTSNTTTVTANPAPVGSTMDKIGIYQVGVWYLDNNGNGAWAAGDSVYSFGGAPGYTAITGDWNATGFTDIGVYKDGVWYLDWNGNGAWDGGDRAYSFGAPGWMNVTGDWNNDGKTDIGVTNGQQWYLDMNNNGVYDSGVDKAYNFGAPGWTPIVGDWNKTGNSYIGVTNGQQWYLDWNGNGAFDSGVDKAYSFGAPGWIPIVGDWNATGFTFIGVTNGQQWYLDWNGNGAFDSGVDKAYNFGAPGWAPILGKWV